MPSPRTLAPYLCLALLGCADDVAAPRPAADASVDAAKPPADEDVPQAPGLARNIAVTGVSLFQSVRVPVLVDGEVVTERSVPVIAGRRAVVRVYVRPEESYQPVSIEGELTLRREGRETVVRDRRYIDMASRDEQPGTAFNFEVPAEWVGADTRIAVRLLAPGGAQGAAGDHPARWPYDGADHAVPAQDDAGGIEVTLVPLRWDADGSGRLPDTSPEQVERMRALLQAMYPVREVRIEVREALPWSRGLLPSGNADFGSVLSMLRALRRTDGAPSNRYYYGVAAPTARFDLYCRRGGCTLGQGYLSLGPDDPQGKVAAGIGFTGDRSAGTLAHELGHNHGRAHAPCGDVAGVDQDFPDEDGRLGSWGYDQRRRTLIRPSAYDFMGYCDPEWISEYNYVAIWQRMLEVNGATGSRAPARAAVAEGHELRHRVLRYGGEAGVEWLDGVALPEALGGDATLRWLDEGGRALRTAVARADALGDSDEVHVLVPPAPAGARAVEVTVGGRSRRVPLPASW